MVQCKSSSSDSTGIAALREGPERGAWTADFEGVVVP